MSAKPLVLLFEDKPQKGAVLERELARALAHRFRVMRLDVDSVASGRGAYEDQLGDLLEGAEFRRLELIVTDRDMSESRRFPGLSEAVISKVAAMYAIPVCVYAAGKSDSVLERQKSGGDGRIILEASDLRRMARRVAVLADGFHTLKSRIRWARQRKTGRGGPAAVLATALGAPEVVEHLTLYTRGDQRMVSELMPLGDADRPDEGRMATALGVWLYDSVLRFPGLILDVVAASSFLNVKQSALVKPAVQRAFREALYDGPFSDPAEPYWWRHRLSDLLVKYEARDGRELVQRRAKTKVPGCPCSFEQHGPAGFVCVITRKPVCEQHSVGQISWLPRGADLSRVRRDLFDELGPWIGVA